MAPQTVPYIRLDCPPTKRTRVKALSNSVGSVRHDIAAFKRLSKAAELLTSPLCLCQMKSSIYLLFLLDSLVPRGSQLMIRVYEDLNHGIYFGTFFWDFGTFFLIWGIIFGFLSFFCIGFWDFYGSSGLFWGFWDFFGFWYLYGDFFSDFFFCIGIRVFSDFVIF